MKRPNPTNAEKWGSIWDGSMDEIIKLLSPIEEIDTQQKGTVYKELYMDGATAVTVTTKSKESLRSKKGQIKEAGRKMDIESPFLNQTSKEFNSIIIPPPTQLVLNKIQHEMKVLYQEEPNIIQQKLLQEGYIRSAKIDRSEKVQRQEINMISSISWKVVPIQRIIALFFQGLFSGYVFTTLFIRVGSNDDNTTLLSIYQPIAEPYRSFGYILSAISFLATIDYLLDIPSHRNPKLPYSSSSVPSALSNTAVGMTPQEVDNYSVVLQSIRLSNHSIFIARLCAVFYFIAFLCTLLMSQGDVLIANQFGYINTASSTATAWINQALSNQKYRLEVDNWKGFERTRFVCVILGWMCCCLLAWKDFDLLTNKTIELIRLRWNALLWLQRAQQFTNDGSDLNGLSMKEMKQMRHVLGNGLKRMDEKLKGFDDDN